MYPTLQARNFLTEDNLNLCVAWVVANLITPDECTIQETFYDEPTDRWVMIIYFTDRPQMYALDEACMDYYNDPE